MARTREKKGTKNINTLHYDKKRPLDKTLFETTNAWLALPKNDDILPSTAVRKFLKQKMKEDLENAYGKKAN